MIADILIHLAVLLFAWWFTIAWHELSHAFFAKLEEGREITAIRLYWHWRNREDDEFRCWRPWEGSKNPYEGKESAFLWGSVMTFGQPALPGNLLSLGPVIASGLTLLVSSTVFALTHSLFPVFFGFCALLDMGDWWKDYFWGDKHSDGKKYRYGYKGEK